MQLKYKHIEAAREARLWVGQIIVPIVGLMVAFPEARNAVAEKVKEIKYNFTSKVKRP